MKRLKTALDKIEGKSALEVARESMARARRRVTRVVSRALDKRGATYISDSDLTRVLGKKSIGEICKSIRTRSARRLTPGLAEADRTSQLIAQLFPDSVAETTRAAEDILKHRIVIFGRVHELGRPIDWHRDPVSNQGYPLVHFSRSTIKRGGAADPRRIWELNRLHHLTTLGRAYLFTRDERYTDEFLFQLASWYDQNPPRFGINWTVAMEAGIRAVNIIAALEMFRSSARLTDKAITLILKLLIAHGRFIRSHLERSHLGSSNHYLGDLIGLLAIGVTLPELSSAAAWTRFAARELDNEMTRQVYSDGVDYEGSTAYHRLALEIFLLALLLERSAGISVSPAYLQRLQAMFDFVRVYLKPDGCAPIIGDSDDGRLLSFRQRPPDDHGYLMALGAALFKDARFKTSDKPDEEMIWWHSAAGLDAFQELSTTREVDSRIFRESQIVVMRHDDLYSIVDCGDHGLQGRGSHAHADALSIELYAYGRTFLRDPGTYVYSASELRRNLFRSTAYHNTVRIDGQDISVIEIGQMFSLGGNVKPRINSWISSDRGDVLDTEHDGYSRLSAPVIHRRRISFDKVDGYWEVFDSFSGTGEHLFEFFFNLDAGLEVSLSRDGLALVRSKEASLAIVPVSKLAFARRVKTRWVSPSYGTRVRSSGIIYSLRSTVPLESVMLLIPFRAGGESAVARITGEYERMAEGAD